MNKTKIKWVKNPDGTQGYTWNPISGCLNHNNGLCKGGGFPCYACKLANTRLKGLYLGNNYARYPAEKHNDPFYPRFWEERLYHPWGGKPKGIFVCDMSDLFGIGIPEEWTRKVLDLAKLHTENRYYLLTKQPQNLIKFSPFPENCWVGVTATNSEMFQRAGIYLGRIKVKIKYISFEPLLERVDFYGLPIQGLNWLIIGAQTNPYKPPLKIWVDEITEAAKKAGIPYFLKDNLRPLLGDNLVQEMP